MQEYIKQYWPVIFSVTTIIVSLLTQWVLLGYRISAVESRQDRQGSAITDIQAQLSTQAANYAALSAKLDAIDNDVTYIRQRIDNVTR